MLFAGELACAPRAAAPKSEPARPCARSEEPRRLLKFQHTARHDSAALDPGQYRFELTHESYAAACELYLANETERRAGKPTWHATCEGDELQIAAMFDHLAGLLLPVQLPAVRARVTHDRAGVFDRIVTSKSRCFEITPGVPEPVEGPGELCLSFSSERWPALVDRDGGCKRRFEGGPSQELHFAFDAVAPYPFQGGAYRFELDGERYSVACDVTLPNPNHAGEVGVRCQGGEVGFWAGINRIHFMSLPARLRSVKVRITRGATVIFDGIAAGAEACERETAPRAPHGLCLYLSPDATRLPDDASAPDE